MFTSGGPPGASERSSAKTRHCRIKVTDDRKSEWINMSVLLCEYDFPGCLAGAWMLTLFTLGRSLLICFRCILSVEEYISKRKGCLWSIQTRIYSIPNEDKPGRVILLAQMPPVLLSVFRLTATA